MPISTGRESTAVAEHTVETNNVWVFRCRMDDIDQVVRLNLNGGVGTASQPIDQLRSKRGQSVGLLFLHNLHPIEWQDQDALMLLPRLGGSRGIVVISIFIIVGRRMTKPCFFSFLLELKIKRGGSKGQDASDSEHCLGRRPCPSDQTAQGQMAMG